MDEQEQQTTQQKNEVVINEALIKQAAALAATGESQFAISKQLKVSRWHVKKIHETDLFRKLVEDVGSEALSNAKVFLRTETAKLSKEIVRVLQEELKDNSLEAVKIGLRVLGLEEKQQEQAPGGLTVVLAGDVKQEQIIEVKEDS